MVNKSKWLIEAFKEGQNKSDFLLSIKTGVEWGTNDYPSVSELRDIIEYLCEDCNNHGNRVFGSNLMNYVSQTFNKLIEEAPLKENDSVCLLNRKYQDLLRYSNLLTNVVREIVENLQATDEFPDNKQSATHAFLLELGVLDE